ncbi:endo-1,4-beta-xylanase [Thalassomonas sp. M1454]|uniref:endo-1,4-beta-xylanase n=1 Tax=Thalassomonas sp. M1454 TaxID=2594477 RepID=UPI0011803247|nr:endo-1,4-beta-xylanase [Thalassomonas sp. M1454]TRX53954.1 hypothetical protein FNN08_13460 [Thalassomonas sp. M1454]
MLKFITSKSTILLSCLTLILAPAVNAKDKVPAGGKVVQYKPALTKLVRNNEFATIKKVDINDKQYPSVLDINVLKKSPKIWGIQVPFAFDNAGITTNDVVMFKIVARSVKSEIADGSVGQMDLFFRFNQKGKPLVNKRLMLTKQWQTLYVPIKIKQEKTTENMRLAFLLGGLDKQQVQIAELELVNYQQQQTVANLPMTKMKYFGHEADAPWRSEANARIEEIRKADYAIKLVDANNNAISNAKLNIELDRHDYSFGCGLKALELFDDKKKRFTKEQKQQQLDNIEEMCNLVVFNNALKWRYYKPEVVARAMQWTAERDLKVRGHALVWGRFRSAHKDIEKKQDYFKQHPEEFQQELLKHVKEFAALYPDQISDWDVINEPSPEHHFVDIVGKEASIEWLEAAKEANPNAQRCANDYGIVSRYDAWHQDAYYDWMKFYTDNNAIDKVCVQGHYQGPMPITEIYERLNRFAEFGLPISMTEFDFFEIDEELKAQFTNDLITVFFSHPSTDAFMHWNLTDLYNEQGQLNLSGQVYDKLIHKTWHTKLESKANKSGEVNFRGFKGRYKVVVTLANGKQSEHLIDFAKQATQQIKL